MLDPKQYEKFVQKCEGFEFEADVNMALHPYAGNDPDNVRFCENLVTDVLERVKPDHPMHSYASTQVKEAESLIWECVSEYDGCYINPVRLLHMSGLIRRIGIYRKHRIIDNLLQLPKIQKSPFLQEPLYWELLAVGYERNDGDLLDILQKHCRNFAASVAPYTQVIDEVERNKGADPTMIFTRVRDLSYALGYEFFHNYPTSPLYSFIRAMVDKRHIPNDAIKVGITAVEPEVDAVYQKFFSDERDKDIYKQADKFTSSLPGWGKIDKKTQDNSWVLKDRERSFTDKYLAADTLKENGNFEQMKTILRSNSNVATFVALALNMPEKEFIDALEHMIPEEEPSVRPPRTNPYDDPSNYEPPEKPMRPFMDVVHSIKDDRSTPGQVIRASYELIGHGHDEDVEDMAVAFMQDPHLASRAILLLNTLIEQNRYKSTRSFTKFLQGLEKNGQLPHLQRITPVLLNRTIDQLAGGAKSDIRNILVDEALARNEAEQKEAEQRSEGHQFFKIFSRKKRVGR